MSKLIAVKNYGPDWYTRFGLSYAQAASTMRRQAIDLAVVQNVIDPLPTTAVEQQIPPKYADRFARYSDRKFRIALRETGIRYFEASACFFGPERLLQWPDLLPMDARGRPMEQVGWYIGLCPSSGDYNASRLDRLEQVVRQMEPDGIFLAWIRFPGFWELWTPETTREEIAEFCFCQRCRRRFQDEADVSLRGGDVRQQARQIQAEFREQWTDWKCAIIADFVHDVRERVNQVRPGTQIMINALAFGRSDYGDVAREVCGQGIEELSAVSDIIEFMFYHQILRRQPGPWIRSVMQEARQRTDRTLLADVQSKADYLDPIYAAGRREPVVTHEEFVEALRATLESPADGLMVYHWKDFLEEEAAGDTCKTDALRAFKAGQL